MEKSKESETFIDLTKLQESGNERLAIFWRGKDAGSSDIGLTDMCRDKLKDELKRNMVTSKDYVATGDVERVKSAIKN